jgi:hypothetical protein
MPSPVSARLEPGGEGPSAPQYAVHVPTHAMIAKAIQRPGLNQVIASMCERNSFIDIMHKAVQIATTRGSSRPVRAQYC